MTILGLFVAVVVVIVIRMFANAARRSSSDRSQPRVQGTAPDPFHAANPNASLKPMNRPNSIDMLSRTSMVDGTIHLNRADRDGYDARKRAESASQIASKAAEEARKAAARAADASRKAAAEANKRMMEAARRNRPF